MVNSSENQSNSRRRIKKVGGNKPLGRPTHNPGYVLSKDQIAFVVAIILTDGWLELGKGNCNPQVGFQNCKRNEGMVQLFVNTLQEVVTAKPLSRFRTALSSGDKLFEQIQIRTVAHPQFHQFLEAFGGHGRNKTIPAVSYLMQVLTWQSLAVILMCDGSRKGEGRGMEIHLQNYKGYKPLGRLCIVLYHKFGIKAYPSYYGISSTGETQYHIQISGFSLPVIRDKVLPLMLPSFTYKIPIPSDSLSVQTYKSPWRKWYRDNKEATWHENISEV